MSGLQRLAKAYGSMIVQGKRWLWDYVADKAVPESDMPDGSERWKASERKRWAKASAMSCPHCDGIAPRGELLHSPGCQNES